MSWGDELVDCQVVLCQVKSWTQTQVTLRSRFRSHLGLKIKSIGLVSVLDRNVSFTSLQDRDRMLLVRDWSCNKTKVSGHETGTATASWMQCRFSTDEGQYAITERRQFWEIAAKRRDREKQWQEPGRGHVSEYVIDSDTRATDVRLSFGEDRLYTAAARAKPCVMSRAPLPIAAATICLSEALL